MKYGFRKLFLIDVTAAFDNNVRRETLRQIIADRLSDNEAIILSFMDIDPEFIMDIMSEKVNTTQGIFQGDHYLSSMFCLYLDEVIRNEPGTQEFMDDVACKTVTNPQIELNMKGSREN